MSETIDPQKFRLENLETFGNGGGATPPGNKEPFVKGPIPWKWLCAAAKCPGQALQVGIALWYFSVLKKSLSVKLNQSRLLDLGTSRDAAKRGLTALEKVGLVRACKQRGRKA